MTDSMINRVAKVLHDWDKSGHCLACGCLYVGFDRCDPCPGARPADLNPAYRAAIKELEPLKASILRSSNIEYPAVDSTQPVAWQAQLTDGSWKTVDGQLLLDIRNGYLSTKLRPLYAALTDGKERE